MSAWRGVEEFLAVVAAGSFTGAAENLGVSKSFVSKTVNELEWPREQRQGAENEGGVAKIPERTDGGHAALPCDNTNKCEGKQTDPALPPQPPCR